MSHLIAPPGVDAARLKAALDVCEKVAAKDRSNLYLTSQFFEDRARYDAFIAMYAVMRLVDDFIDNVPDKAAAPASVRAELKAELDRWERRIRDAHPQFSDPARERNRVALRADLRRADRARREVQAAAQCRQELGGLEGQAHPSLLAGRQNSV